jgi:spore germination cell wall hydrolase CwlJ-like protein
MSCVLAMPTSVGHQDLASLIARETGGVERGRQHLRLTTFGTIHAAMLSFPRPVGSTIPDAPGYQLASLDPRAVDIARGIRRSDPFYDPFAELSAPPRPRYEFPTVDRRLKGDRLATQERPPAPQAPAREPRKDQPQASAKAATAERDLLPAWSGHEPFAVTPQLIAEAARFDARRRAAAERAARGAMLAMKPQAEAEPFAVGERDIVLAEQAARARIARETAVQAAAARAVPQLDAKVWAQPEVEPFAISDALIADAAEIAAAREEAAETQVAGWPERREAESPVMENDRILTDEEPTEDGGVAAPRPDNPAIEMARLYFGTDSLGEGLAGLESYAPGEAPTLIIPRQPVDPELKLSAQTPDAKAAETAADPAPAKDGEDNQTIAAKGEVTGEGKRPRTPAELLQLAGAARAKHERCLTNAIYFEARGESERGQMAVAQVVMNRVFSQYYPDNICGVVYQNAHRHLACQFTFACDNVRDVVKEPDAWEVAKRIARDTLDGKIWLPEIGKATHYHATYVNPWWVRTMNKHKTLGIHIFYRPKRWGDGSDEPVWSPAELEVTGSIRKGASAQADKAGPAAKL